MIVSDWRDARGVERVGENSPEIRANNNNRNLTSGSGPLTRRPIGARGKKVKEKKTPHDVAADHCDLRDRYLTRKA